MTPGAWPSPQGPEYALVCDRRRSRRLLVVPALFEAGNRLRRFTVEVMRRLDAAGVDGFLPDLPGTGESLAPLAAQTPASWRAAMRAAADHFAATAVLAIHGGALLAPPALPGWRYAPADGAALLRPMLRARVLASREAGAEETSAGLLEQGRRAGLDLAGYALGAAFLAEFAVLEPETSGQTVITQDMIGGGGLWLRAEPGESREQADALAAIVALGIGG
ncbi:MAG: hypothetical protein KGK11_04485 [Sphingomonadales bacterium]|nr:hypothetical protein [Sphingomonadales bacterium]